MAYLIGYSIVNLNGSYLLETGAFDANNQTFSVTVDSTVIKRPGRYVLIKATSMVNCTSATILFSGTTDLRSRRVVLNEQVIFPDGNTYSCLIADLA